MSTDYHSRYYAYELTRRFSSDKLEKLSQSFFNATVDLNPHQIAAALFAFRSPLSRGAILADEVGLGKTVEAGLIISQLWAERKRRILIILPAALREQWNRELIEKFFIDSIILESRNFNQLVKEGVTYAPSDSVYWQHGHSTERDFIYVTTQTLTREQLAALSEEVGDVRTLLICCGAFRVKRDAFANLTLKKIPNAVLNRCEFGRDDYSMEVSNLAEAPVLPGTQATLFAEEDR